MRNYILFDDVKVHRQLLPLTFTRPIAELRLGILTIKEKWEFYLNSTASYLTQHYLQEKFPITIAEENILINSSVLPNLQLIQEIAQLNPGGSLSISSKLIAACIQKQEVEGFKADKYLANAKELTFEFNQIAFPEDIFQQNAKELSEDFTNITSHRNSQLVPVGTHVLGYNLFIEEGAKINFALINTETGPVYIGKDTEIMEGSLIRGPFAACSGSVVKMGAKIYGATTLGPNSVVGGEVKNCVILGNSNKGHEGYLGDSVIGEWCNLGADTNNSNLKNNFGSVKVWNYETESLRDSGLQKHGVIMGDHSKTSVNTMFNTGTIVGVGCNIATSGFPIKFVPDFSWLNGETTTEYQFEKFCQMAEAMMKTKKNEFNAVEKRILEHVFNSTRKKH